MQLGSPNFTHSVPRCVLENHSGVKRSRSQRLSRILDIMQYCHRCWYVHKLHWVFPAVMPCHTSSAGTGFFPHDFPASACCRVFPGVGFCTHVSARFCCCTRISGNSCMKPSVKLLFIWSNSFLQLIVTDLLVVVHYLLTKLWFFFKKVCIVEGGTGTLLGGLFWVDLIKWVSNLRTSVRLSTKGFFDLNEIWRVHRRLWVMHESVLCDLIQGQGHEPLENWKSVYFEELSPPPFKCELAVTTDC